MPFFIQLFLCNIDLFSEDGRLFPLLLTVSCTLVRYFCQVKERTSITNPLLQKMLVTLQQVGGLPALQKLSTWSSLVTEDFHQQLLRNSVGRKHPSSMEIELQQLRRLSHVQANATSMISNQLTTPHLSK